jgi:hypothetical protein
MSRILTAICLLAFLCCDDVDRQQDPAVAFSRSFNAWAAHHDDDPVVILAAYQFGATYNHWITAWNDAGAAGVIHASEWRLWRETKNLWVAVQNEGNRAPDADWRQTKRAWRRLRTVVDEFYRQTDEPSTSQQVIAYALPDAEEPGTMTGPVATKA